MAQARHDSITRRSLLSGAAAAVPAAAMPAAALPASPATAAVASAAPDPIFAAIKAHVHAYDDVNAILDAVAAAEDALDAAKRGTRRAARKRLSAARAEEARLGGIETDATERLVATVPQTLQGAAAALRYITGAVRARISDVRGGGVHGAARVDRRMPVSCLGGAAPMMARARMSGLE